MEPGGYQKIGPTLWTAVFGENNYLLEKTTCLPTDIIYPYEPDNIQETLKLAGGIDKIQERTVGIHWFNGSKAIKNFINKTPSSVMSVSYTHLTLPTKRIV